jgi:hypothetical protein
MTSQSAAMICLVFVLWAAVYTEVTSTSYKQANYLHNKTLLDYNKDLIPVKNQTDAIGVNISLNVVALIDYDEVQGFIAIAGFLTVTWIDEIIPWNPEDYGGRQSLMIPQNHIWRPSLYSVGSVDKFTEIGDASFKIRYTYMGEATWQPGGIMKSACSADIRFYPFDIQSCQISFSAFGYTDNEIQLLTPLSYVNQGFFDKNGEWKIINTTSYFNWNSVNSFITFGFTLERQPTFFIVNILIPILLLGALNELVFLLPAASGERMSFAITTLLSYTVFMTMLSDTMPQTAEPMSFLSYYVMLMMFHSTFIAMATIAVLRLYNKEDTTPVPAHIVTVVNVMR